ncbi:MAG TPA: ABC transporter ATP-binding protein [Firmicutes bacterium]|nr:ABC transporter ATP-binding protein [Bacillota bacterium]
MQPVIQLFHLSKLYQITDQQIDALRGIDLTILPGEFVTIVGQSGSGKSTLMNILGCLDVPTSGKYLLRGQDTGKMDDRQLSLIRNREIGFIFQGFNLIPSLDALENVELPLIYRGIRERERKALCTKALIRVGLKNRIHHRPSEMSGGQQQRVAIARAIAASPSLILADEPTGNLDRNSSREVLSLLDELHQAGSTIVLITHDDSIAASAKRCIRIEDGKIVSDILSRQSKCAAG